MNNQSQIESNHELTLADFTSLQLTFVDSSERSVYSTRSAELSRLAYLAASDGNLPKAKALRVLADICSVWWSNSYSCFSKTFENINNSFDESTHQAIAEYCKTDNLDFWLQAWLAESAYLRQPRTEFATIALQAYAKAPLTWRTWFKGGSAFWLRALTLEKIRGVTLLSPRTKTRLLEAALNPSDEAPNEFTSQLASSFYTQKIPVSKAELMQLSEVLNKVAINYSGEVRDLTAAERYELLANWHQKLQNPLGHAQHCYKAANAYIRAANAHPESFMAAKIYESAVASLENIPRKYRGAWNECSHIKFPVDTLITRLKRIITQEKKLIHGQMQSFSGAFSIQKADIEAEATKSVGGKSLDDAFKALTSLDFLIPSKEDIQVKTAKSLKESVFSQIGTRFTLTSTGNTSAIAPPDSDASELGEMVRIFCIIGALHSGLIDESLVIIRTEHPNATLQDCVNFCTECCSAIPENQRKQWGAALFAGYKGDWINALHLIAPLLENLLRFVHLTNFGQSGSTKDKDGTDNEVSLNTLLAKPALAKLLGEDYVFALDALFCNGLGPNLRNTVAHGLVDDSLCDSSIVTYAWWLAFCVASQFTLRSNEAMGEQP